jgi:hypothetical protein
VNSGPSGQGPRGPKRNRHEAAKSPLEGQEKKAWRQRHWQYKQWQRNTVIQSDTLPITQIKHDQDNQCTTAANLRHLTHQRAPEQRPGTKNPQAKRHNVQQKKDKTNERQQVMTEEITDQGCAGLECLVVSDMANYTNTRLKAT